MAARILLTEDDEDVRELLRDVLTDAGYEVDDTDTVAGALTRLGRNSYDLVLTDGRLPDGNGLTIAAKAKELGLNPILFTGFASDYPPEELAKYTVLRKPMGMDDLVRVVARMLGD